MISKQDFTTNIKAIFNETERSLVRLHHDAVETDHADFINRWFLPATTQLGGYGVEIFFDEAVKEMHTFWDSIEPFAREYDLLPKENLAIMIGNLAEFLAKNQLTKSFTTSWPLAVTCKMDYYTDLNTVLGKGLGLAKPHLVNSWVLIPADKELSDQEFRKEQSYLNSNGLMYWIGGVPSETDITRQDYSQIIKNAYETKNYKGAEYAEPEEELEDE